MPSWSLPTWTVHGTGKTVSPGEVVAPNERLSWPRTIGIGAQHIAAMFGATFLVPILTGFPPTTTLLFSGIGTLVFVLITRNRIPSYLGSSFAFIAPVMAAKSGGDISVALGGIVAVGIMLMLVGLVVQRAGASWIEKLMPPVVTGTIVAVIGLNLAGVAKGGITDQPFIGVVTLGSSSSSPSSRVASWRGSVSSLAWWPATSLLLCRTRWTPVRSRLLLGSACLT